MCLDCDLVCDDVWFVCCLFVFFGDVCVCVFGFRRGCVFRL